jgi:integrase/recombinase XerD
MSDLMVPEEIEQLAVNKQLTRAEFEALGDVSAEDEWLRNLTNDKTRRAYKADVGEFLRFNGIDNPEDLRSIGRPHVILWRDNLTERELAPSTVRRKLSALASLFDYLCEKNAVEHNPVDGVKRPVVANGNEGSTPALGDDQVRLLLEAPDENSLKGTRDRAILATLLYHGIRREELCNLRIRDIQSRQGVLHFRIKGKRGKIRYVPVHPAVQRLIQKYLKRAGHIEDVPGALFRPVRNNRTGELDRHLDPSSIYKNVVRKYGLETGISGLVDGLCVHSLRATAATNALSNDADIAKVQEWLGHANVSTTRLYDRRKTKPEESPTFRVKY